MGEKREEQGSSTVRWDRGKKVLRRGTPLRVFSEANRMYCRYLGKRETKMCYSTLFTVSEVPVCHAPYLLFSEELITSSTVNRPIGQSRTVPFK